LISLLEDKLKHAIEHVFDGCADLRGVSTGASILNNVQTGESLKRPRRVCSVPSTPCVTITLKAERVQ
jgi:hypothetical protein